MQRFLFSIAILITGLVLFGCNGTGIETIGLSAPGRNTLKVRMDVKTTGDCALRIEYWRKSDSLHKFTSPQSPIGTDHALVLTNLRPKSEYLYHVISSANGKETTSKIYDFEPPATRCGFRTFPNHRARFFGDFPMHSKKASLLFSAGKRPALYSCWTAKAISGGTTR